MLFASVDHATYSLVGDLMRPNQDRWVIGIDHGGHCRRAGQSEDEELLPSLLGWGELIYSQSRPYLCQPIAKWLCCLFLRHLQSFTWVVILSKSFKEVLREVLWERCLAHESGVASNHRYHASHVIFIMTINACHFDSDSGSGRQLASVGARFVSAAVRVFGI